MDHPPQAVAFLRSASPRLSLASLPSGFPAASTTIDSRPADTAVLDDLLRRAARLNGRCGLVERLNRGEDARLQLHEPRLPAKRREACTSGSRK